MDDDDDAGIRNGKLLSTMEPNGDGLWKFSCYVCRTSVVGSQEWITKESGEHYEKVHNTYLIDKDANILDAEIIE